MLNLQEQGSFPISSSTTQEAEPMNNSFKYIFLGLLAGISGTVLITIFGNKDYVVNSLTQMWAAIGAATALCHQVGQAAVKQETAVKEAKVAAATAATIAREGKDMLSDVADKVEESVVKIDVGLDKIDKNTEITTDTKKIVNGKNDALQAEVDVLKSEIAKLKAARH